MEVLSAGHRELLRELAEELLRFETTHGEEGPAQRWLADRLGELGFRTRSWEPDPAALAAHPSFPPAEDLDLADRPSIAGVLEFGDPEAGRTLVLNGHIDVVPVERDHWTRDPFEPTWDGETLTARGAVDMKSQLAMAIVAARALADEDPALDGRVVVESVAGEEDGGLGAATAAIESPYPFERDAAIVVEPTEDRIVTATEGCAMVRLRVEGRSAHAARRWRGEDVLPHFERIRRAFVDLEAERATAITHPGYERFENPWPVVVGRVEAGNWASNAPGQLTAEARLGVAPGERVADVEAQFRERLESVATENAWLKAHPPTLERVGVQFEPAEISHDEPIVRALQEALSAAGRHAIEPVGETYGADSRHLVAAGIPTVVYGPGRIEEAHFPDESIRWPDVEAGAAVLVEAVRRFLSG